MSPEERERAALHQRRHRARQRGEEEPPLPLLDPKPRKPRPKMSNEERRAKQREWEQSEAGQESRERYRKSEKNREAQHRYKTSEKGRAKGREDRKKYWQRKRAAAKTVECVCDCGRTFERPYKPGKPRTKCEVCSPPQPDRNVRARAHREEQRRLRAERAAVKAAVAPAQVGTKTGQTGVSP
jgi:hypothetical protein